jgi:hypothetical protein
MKEIILQPQEINQPRNPVKIEPGQTPTDWIKDHEDPVLGANIERIILCKDRNWVPFITEIEVQFNKYFDAFRCVTESAWNKIQCLGKRLFNVVLNKSKRYTAKKSGTIPNRGNSVTAVVESIRTKHGGVPEEVWPSMTETMTVEEHYKEIPPEVDAKEDFLKEYEYKHEWLPNEIMKGTLDKIIDDGLLYSPVMVSIEGWYSFDEQGRLKWGGRDYTHEVLVVKSEPDCFLVLDSENPKGLMKVRRDYPFGYPKIGYLKKKIMFKLIKTVDKPNVYLLSVASGNRYGVADGQEVKGGDLLKTFSGTYKNAAIQVISQEEMEKYPHVGNIKAEQFQVGVATIDEV